MKLKLPLGQPFPVLRSLRAQYRRAASQAMNRTAASIRAAGVRQVATIIGLKQKDVRAATRIEKATVSKFAAAVIAMGKALSLIRFGARQTPAGVSFRIGGQRKIRIGAFIAKMPSGHIGVFQRMGEKVRPIRGAFAGRTIRRGPRRGQPILRQPLEELFGPSIPGAFKEETITEAMKKIASERFPIEFRQALANILRRGR